MVRVVLADDHALVRNGLVDLLDRSDGIDVVGQAADGRGAVDAIARHEPDVAVVDVSMPGGIDGVEVARQVAASGGPTRVLLLTTTVDRELLQRALAAGAAGLVLKEAEPAEFVRAVRAVAAGDRPLDPKAARLLLEADPRPVPPAPPGSAPAPAPTGGLECLTARQLEVLTLVANGCSNKQIARALGVAEKTVKAHLTSIFQALGVHDRTEAAVWLTRRSQGA